MITIIKLVTTIIKQNFDNNNKLMITIGNNMMVIGDNNNKTNYGEMKIVVFPFKVNVIR